MATTTVKKITPADIGAVNKAGDTMTGPLNIRNNVFAHCIELVPPDESGNGGYIDFAYNGEVIDNTSRIIEGARGVLDINGITFDKANPFISITNGGTGATTAVGARANLNVAEKQLCESPNSQWRLEIHDDGIVRVWRYDANSGWTIAGVLRDENGAVPIWFGGTGATTPAGALANLGVICRQFSVTFDSNGLGTVNDPPQGYTLMAGNLDTNWIITVHGPYVFARSASDLTTFISSHTSAITLLYVKNN